MKFHSNVNKTNLNIVNVYRKNLVNYQSLEIFINNNIQKIKTFNISRDF